MPRRAARGSESAPGGGRPNGAVRVRRLRFAALSSLRSFPVTRRLAALLLAFSCAPAAIAAPAPARDRAAVGAVDREDPQALGLLRKLQAAQQTTKVMTSSFRQVKEDALFSEPSVQSGKFAFSTPQNFRWDYEKPEHVIVLVTQDTFQRYLPDQKLLRRMDLSRNKRRVFNYFGLGTDVEVLRRHFHLTAKLTDQSRPGTEKLELRGKRRRVQKRLQLLEMWLDAKSHLPAAIKVTMADGATTLWEFSDMKVNPTVPDSTFALKVPKDTIIQSEDDPQSPLINDLLEEEETAAGGAQQP
jgi:outer membrane lipoprotein-sorting protein